MAVAITNMLPQAWSQGKLVEIISHTGIVSDGDWIESKDQDPNGTVRLVQLADIGDGRFLSKSSRFMTIEAAKRLNCTFLKEGDVLIARMPDPMGRACLFPIVEHQSVTVVDVCLIRPNENSALGNDLFKYWINSPQIRSEISLQATGSTRKRITRKKLSAFDFPIPPIQEQKRIVEKLDSLLAQVDTIQQRLNTLPNIIKRFRQSVLAAAVSGKLTEQWRDSNNFNVNIDELKLKIVNERKELGFKTPRNVGNIDLESVPFEIPTSWKWEMMGNLSVKITDGAHNTPKVFDEGHPYLMAKDLTKGKLDFSENRFISEKDHRELYNKCRPEVGDLLIVNIGAGTGNNVSVNVSFEFSFKNIAIIKNPSFIESKYLKWYFDSQKQRIFNEQTRGGAQPFLSLTVLNNLEFALPPIEEQTEIVRLVEQYFALADTLEKHLKNAKQRVDNLTQAILAKAFKGELVPQDPNDEPADKLLELIKAAREEAEKLEKVAKKAAKASKVKKK
jgi:type I restriction enzyme S subunit